jgi:hypothetical protein|tara:strand:- start:837 stop:1037 length:201 start_codon:yes stop_codon:yes gene_type:complete
LLVVILDVLALAQVSITDIAPIALPLGCIGIITFDSVLLLANYLSHVTLPPAYQEKMRKLTPLHLQ